MTVPQVFLAGKLIGGADATIGLLGNGTLTANSLHVVGWDWVEAMHTNPELVVGVEYYRMMGEIDGGTKVFKPPQKTEQNQHVPPSF